MSRSRPKLSDDHLLATISVLAGDASDARVRKALTKRLGQEIGLAYVRERLRRLSYSVIASGAQRRECPIPQASPPFASLLLRHQETCTR